jgi:hypothetical protein
MQAVNTKLDLERDFGQENPFQPFQAKSQKYI